MQFVARRTSLIVVPVTHLEDLSARGRRARQMILEAGLPKEVRKAISESYNKLCQAQGGRGDVSVAVRSSATAEGTLSLVLKESTYPSHLT
jgi:pyruvate, water dikinase